MFAGRRRPKQGNRGKHIDAEPADHRPVAYQTSDRRVGPCPSSPRRRRLSSRPPRLPHRSHRAAFGSGFFRRQLGHEACAIFFLLGPDSLVNGPSPACFSPPSECPTVSIVIQTPDAFQPMIAMQGDHTLAFRTQIYQQILDAIATHRVADRPDRFEPRRIKRRPKPYDRLMKPRHQAETSNTEWLSGKLSAIRPPHRCIN